MGLVLITIFMVCGGTILKGTYNTYRLVEQKSMAMAYLIKAVELELLDDNVSDSITDDHTQTQTLEDDPKVRTVKTTKIEAANNLTITTIVEVLPTKNGVDYKNSRVKLLTGTAEYYIRKNDESSKRVLTIKTLKIEGVDTNEG